MAARVASATPPVAEVHRQVLLQADLMNQVERSWKKRIPWQGLTPQLRVSVQRDLDETLKVSLKDSVSISGGNVTIGPDKQDINRDYDAGTRVQVTAVWYLDKLVFSRDSILVSQERRRRHEERIKLLDKVTQHYFERIAALETLRSQRLSFKERLKLKTIVRDRTARLDAYTGGWFGRSLHKEKQHES